MPREQGYTPLLEGGDLEAEPRRLGTVGKVVGALLGSVGLVCLATTQTKGQTVPFDANFLGKWEKYACPNKKKTCAEMIMATGPMEQEMRSISSFEHLVVGDIVSVTSFKVVEGAVNTITFTANESLLSALEADVTDGTLTVGSGCACDPKWPDRTAPGKITASIVSSTWPQSVRFDGSSSGHFTDLSGAASIKAEGAAGLYIGSVTADAVDMKCIGAAALEVGSVKAVGAAAFTSIGACNLHVKAGSSASSSAEVIGASNIDLGSFRTKTTNVKASGSCSFAGQLANNGTLKATGASYLSTNLTDGGSATCSGIGYVGVTTAGNLESHKSGICSVEVKAPPA